jgi:hypothetical protein
MRVSSSDKVPKCGPDKITHPKALSKTVDQHIRRTAELQKAPKSTHEGGHPPLLALSSVESAVGLSAFVLLKGPLRRKKMCYIIGQHIAGRYNLVGACEYTKRGVCRDCFSRLSYAHKGQQELGGIFQEIGKKPGP